MKWVVALTALILVLAACASAPTPAPTTKAVSISPSPSPSQLPVTIADLAQCPVTRPGRAPASIQDALFGSGSADGNSRLWVGGLGDGGVIAADNGFINPDGSVGWKLGWWREVSGDLTITGQRLDAGAAPLESDVPSGYGQTGFQASGLTFPTEGCWQITGHVGAASLTFVTFVIKAASAMLSPSELNASAAQQWMASMMLSVERHSQLTWSATSAWLPLSAEPTAPSRLSRRSPRG